jgi:hypothetical protein
MPSHLAEVQSIRSKYPTPLGATHAAFLIEVAKTLGAKLFKKPGGSNVLLPNGVPVSMDIIILNGQWIDILSDSEGAANPTWDAHDNATGEFVDVSGLGTPVPPPPVINQPPAVPDPTVLFLSDQVNRLLARVTVLENKPEVIPAGLILDLNSRIDEVDTRIDKLKFRIQGNTGKSIGHVHSISLQVIPE